MGDVTESSTTSESRVVRNTLRGRNDASPRTTVANRRGVSMTTDEPVARGGTDTALSPLETVVGALCGCASVTFERAAHEAGLEYSAIDFDAGYVLDRRGLLGEAPIRPYYQSVAVHATVHTTGSPEALAAVVTVTEERCPVRNLLVDAGVDLVMTWSIATAPLPA